jgi:tetratricopeptide (TPR) repeat protein
LKSLKNSQNQKKEAFMLKNSTTLRIAARYSLWVNLIVCIYALLFSIPAQAAEIKQLDPSVEKALLAEEWEKVVTLLKDVTPETQDPVLRMIKGHACLATNRNNESLCLFLSATNDSSITSYNSYCKIKVSQNPENCAFNYLMGDALARKAQWDSAIIFFTKSLCKNSRHYLSLNSRCIVYAFKEVWDSALVDIDDAIKAKLTFADAYATKGALRIHMRKMPKGALDAYSNAIKINPNFFLAHNGSGAIQLVLSQWEQAEKELKEASQLKTDCLNQAMNIVDINTASLSYAKSVALLKKGMEIAGIDYGTYIGGKTVTSENYQNLVESYKNEFRPMLPDKAARVGGYINNAVPFSETFGSKNPLNWATKTDVSFENNANLKAGLIGKVPFIVGTGETKANVNASFDFKGDYTKDLLVQKAAQQAYNEVWGNKLGAGKPPSISDLVNPFSDLRREGFDFTHSSGKTAGGVCPEGLSQAKVETGDWKIVTLYGLFYRKTN